MARAVTSLLPAKLPLSLWSSLPRERPEMYGSTRRTEYSETDMNMYNSLMEVFNNVLMNTENTSSTINANCESHFFLNSVWF